jgi:hypothetical protein
LNPCGTNPENGTVNEGCDPATGGIAEGKTFNDVVVDPYNHSGIVTPKSEWCSDACGIMTVDVWPVCVRGQSNSIAVSLRSGSVMSEPISIEVTHESADEDSEENDEGTDAGTELDFWDQSRIYRIEQ